MGAETLDAEVKARIPEDQKVRLQKIADSRHLKVADIIREAVREKINLEQTPTKIIPRANGRDNGR